MRAQVTARGGVNMFAQALLFVMLTVLAARAVHALGTRMRERGASDPDDGDGNDGTDTL